MNPFFIIPIFAQKAVFLLGFWDERHTILKGMVMENKLMGCKYWIFLLVGLFFVGNLPGQNLLLNPSFENFSACPLGPSEFDNTNFWQSPFINLIGDTCSTSDLFNSCNIFGSFGVDVPNNIMGSQAPITGSGYAGIIATEQFALIGCTALFGTGWREYVEGTLSSPLVAAQDYCVTFHVSLADNVKYATDDFGVHLSNSLVNVNCNTVGGSSALQPLGFAPQLVWAGGDITNTSGWTQLQWTYNASGGEQFVTFGNFQNDGGTSFTCVNGGAFNPYAYYYVEDASVIPGACPVLPAELASFAAERQFDGAVKLAWSTANEINNGFFSLERSIDGIEWEKVGTEPGVGFSSKATAYSMIDAGDRFEVLYYKISQTDQDGRSSFLQIASLEKEDNGEFEIGELYPNPAQGEFYYEVKSGLDTNSPLRIKCYDMMGELLHKEVVLPGSLKAEGSISTAQLPNGLYHVLFSQGKKQFRKMIVVKH